MRQLGLRPARFLRSFLSNTLQDRPKYLPVNDGLESLQWITRLAQAGAAVLKVKEVVLYLLDYPSPAVRVTFEDQIQGDL